MTEENNNSNPTEKILTNIGKQSDDELLKLARQQKAEHDKERKEWEVKERERAKNEFALLSENTQIKKDLTDVKKALEGLKYKTMLEKEMEINSVDNPPQLTPEQKSKQLLAEVIAERRQQAEESRKKKENNTFYL